MVEAALLNDDPYVDIVLGFFNQPAQPRLLINSGDGHFTDQTAARFPTLSVMVNDIACLDIDNDGDLDLFFACRPDATPQANHDVLLLNNGQGIFTDVSATHLPPRSTASNSVDWGLANNDPYPDLIVTGSIPAGVPAQNQIYLYVNDGTGRFTLLPDSAIQSTALYGAYDAVFADVNRDQRTDFVLGCLRLVTIDGSSAGMAVYSGQSAVFIQDSAGIFHDETSLRMPQMERMTRMVKISDVNNDNAPDIYEVNVGFDPQGATNVLYMNNGLGYFQDETGLRLPPEMERWNNDAEFTDVDHDGFMDIFMINVVPGQPAYDNLYMNTAGFFRDESVHLPPIYDFNVSTAVGDIEVDMDSDIYLSTTGGAVGEILPDRLYQNLYLAVGLGRHRSVPTADFQLLASYPNPFNARIRIAYRLNVIRHIHLASLQYAG